MEGFGIVNIKPFELVTLSEHLIDRHLPDQMVNAVNETWSPKRGRLREPAPMLVCIFKALFINESTLFFKL